MARLVMLFMAFIINGYVHATIVVGTLSYNPPFEYVMSNKKNFSGFGIELMNALCHRINETCQYKPMSIRDIFSEIQKNNIDLAIASITITQERQSQYLFSIPYLASKYQLIAKKGSLINTQQDVSGKKLGVVKGSLFEGIAKELFTSATLVEVDDDLDLFYSMTKETVDASLLDEATAKYWMINDANLFKLIGNGVSIGKGYGIMSNIKNTTLIERMNQALLDIEKDGTYLLIYQKYF